MTELVKQVMRTAHIDTTDEELVEKIAPHLKGHRYGPSSIAHWRSGRYRPSAEDIFAVAVAREISLDEILFGASLKAELRLLADRVRQLEGPETP